MHVFFSLKIQNLYCTHSPTAGWPANILPAICHGVNTWVMVPYLENKWFLGFISTGYMQVGKGIFNLLFKRKKKREKTTFWDLNWQVALGFWHLCLICVFLFSLLQLLLHKSSTFFPLIVWMEKTDWEVQLPSRCLFLGALEVVQDLKSTSVNFFDKVSFYQASALPCRCVPGTKQQLLQSDRVTFSCKGQSCSHSSTMIP